MNRDKLWEIMQNKFQIYLLNTIKCIYRNTKVRIKFNDGISEPIHINKGVGQGYGLPPVLFNIYINKIIQEFKIVIKKGIPLNNKKISEHYTICRWPNFNGHIRRWITNNGIPPETYSKKIQNYYIQHKNKINGNVWELHTGGNKMW